MIQLDIEESITNPNHSSPVVQHHMSLHSKLIIIGVLTFLLGNGLFQLVIDVFALVRIYVTVIRKKQKRTITVTCIFSHRIPH